jgi:hypothetical protein
VLSGPLRSGESAVAALIFIVACLIYLVSPVVTSSDAMFAMHRHAADGHPLCRRQRADGRSSACEPGLLVFSPILLLAGYGFVQLVRGCSTSALDWAYVAYGVSLWLFVAAWPIWSGGHCYGPRMMSDALPFLVLYLATAWDALAARRTALPGMAGFFLLLVTSCAIHARGATDWDVWRWNGRPGLEDRL